MDRFDANYGIGCLNPADTPTYGDHEDAQPSPEGSVVSRNGQQAAD